MLGALLFSLISISHASVSCECAEVSCSPCEEQVNLDFYTSKCGTDLNEVKSCAKPVCKIKEPVSKSCQAFAEKKINKRVPASIPKNVEKIVLDPQPELGNSNHEIAEVLKFKGKVIIRDTLNRKQPVSPSMLLYEGDTIITFKDAMVSVRFTDNNEAIISENSTFQLTKYKAQTDQQKGNAVLELLKGRVRSKVQQKYKDDKNTGYKVKTKAAVAGVRGTDFVVTYLTGKKLTTTVETLEGSVELSGEFGDEKSLVKKDHKQSYVVDAQSIFNKKEINSFVKKGYMTPLYKLTKNELQELDWKTSFNTKRATASVAPQATSKSSNSICEAPSAQLNQCYWQCVGNPRGESRCRIELENVKCVRKRCNANGVWADSSRIPASQITNCPATGLTVKDCDY